MITVDPAVPGSERTVLTIFEHGKPVLSMSVAEARALAFCILRDTEAPAPPLSSLVVMRMNG